MRLDVLGRIRAHRSLLSGVAIAVVAAVPITLAIVHQGFPVSDVDLDSQNVWVTNGEQLLGGRLNHQIAELDAKVNGSSSHLDVLQDGGATILTDTSQGSAQVIDPAFVSLTQKISVPIDSQLAYGLDTLAVLGPDGRLWVIDASDRLSFDPAKSTPVAKLGVGAKVVVSKGGVTYAASPTLKRLVTVQHPGAVATSAALAVPKTFQLTAVGEHPLLLDTAAKTLIRADGGSTKLPGTPMKLQQAGPDNTYAVVATGDSLLEVPVAGGTPVVVPAKITRPVTSAKGVSAPVFLAGCAYGAWGGAQRYLYACDGRAPITQDIGQPTVGSDLEFRVNHGVIALNNLQNGNAWVVSSNIRLVNNWAQLNPQQTETNSDDGKEKPVQQSFADELANRTDVNHSPVAVDDSFGVRPGRTTVLPVLDNDTDQDGDVLTITAVDGLTSSQGTVDLIEGGRALQFTPSGLDLSSASFRYTITDGRKAYASANVNVTLRPLTVNTAPVAKRSSTTAVEVGQSIAYNVLKDWIDPDGDDVYLLNASSTTPDLVQFQPDGTITFSSKTGQTGAKQVAFTVSDGHATTTGSLEVDVKAVDSMDPVAVPDYATTLSTVPVVLHPLDNDQSPSGAPLQLVGAKAEFGGPVSIAVDQANSTLTVQSNTAGEYYLVYTLAAGSHTTQGLALVNVSDPQGANQAPIAVNDVVYVRPGEPTSVNVLDNDISPSGRVLVLQSVTSAADASTLNVEVLDKSVVRVTSPGVLGQQLQLTYTVSDGLKSAKAGITVVPIPPLVNHQAPVAADDTATVRAGDIVSVHVLDNDSSPDNEPFTLDPALADTSNAGTGSTAFVSGSLVRYQAPTVAGDYSVTYSITDKFGQKANASVAFAVTAKGGKDRPPMPQELNARAFAGTSSQIVVPLDGIDPEGDSVSLDGIATPPGLGRITDVTTTSFTYEAYPNSAGTDHFTYQVEDTAGKTAIGTVNVGIAPRPSTSKPPIAVDDKVEIKPGKTAAVPVLLNDSDPNGYTISLKKTLTHVEAPLKARVVGATVLITAPDNEGAYSVGYQITNGEGGQAPGVVQVLVTKDATPQYPTAADHVIGIEQLTGKSDIDVSVLDGALNPSGLASDLKIAVRGPNASAAQVKANGKVNVTPGEHRMAITYSLTDETTGLSGDAFIIVPPKPGSAEASTAPPHIKDGLNPIIKMNGSEQFDLSKIVDVPSGRPIKIVNGASAKATNSNGQSPFVNAQQLTFTGAKDYRGPAAITFQVDDGRDPGTTQDRVTLLTLQITVGSADQSDVPPTFTPPNETVQAGEAAIEVNLRDSTYQPNPQILSQVTYSGFSSSNPAIRFSNNGSTLSLSADFGVQPGTSAVISFTVNSGEFHIPGSVNAKVVSSTKPKAQQKTVPTSNFERSTVGQTTLSDAAGSNYWINPFADKNQPLTIVAAKLANAQSGVTVSYTASTLTVKATTAAPVGTVTVNYTVQDATKDPTRNVVGQWTVTIHDIPGKGATPTATTATHNDGKADVTISAPSDNGNLTIDSYNIRSVPAASTKTVSATGTYTMTGLTNGTAYTFQVQAHNSDGWGAWSDASKSVTPYGTPSAPRNLDGSAAGTAPTTVSYSWDVPSDTGGGTVTYHYTYDGSSGTTSATSKSFTGQGAGNHTFSVFAVNDHSGNAGATAGPKTVNVTVENPSITAHRNDGYGEFGTCGSWSCSYPAASWSNVTPGTYTICEQTGPTDSISACKTMSIGASGSYTFNESGQGGVLGWPNNTISVQLKQGGTTVASDSRKWSDASCLSTSQCRNGP
ncbi:MAG: tandem-95 repeat protein [Microbacteriaceae bacterium]|nr:tandem-95 repeat protein [Microbacteriaceae bacterium]